MCFYTIIISGVWAVTVDAKLTNGNVSTNQLLSFHDEKNSDDKDDTDDQNTSHSSTIVGICLLATYGIVILFGFVTMRKELGQVGTISTV
jgi:hypothetical protein